MAQNVYETFQISPFQNFTQYLLILKFSKLFQLDHELEKQLIS